MSYGKKVLEFRSRKIIVVPKEDLHGIPESTGLEGSKAKDTGE